MTKVKVIKAYKDLELKRTVAKNDEFEVSEERANVLVTKELAIIVGSDLGKAKDTKSSSRKRKQSDVEC